MFVAASATVTVSDVTLLGGRAGVGSGLYNEGVLTLRRCTLADNVADFYGGGIEQYAGLLTIEDSALAGNFAGSTGGGALDIIGGFAVVRNSTLSGNGSRAGGAIYRDTGGGVALLQCTIAANYGQNVAGGVYSAPGADVSAVVNTLVGDNETDGLAPDLAASVVSLGYNLVGNAEGAGGFGSTDLLNTNAWLAPLQDNGGATPTHALLPESPAINRGDPATTTNEATFDQRGSGYPRQRGIRVDIGAYEYPNPDDDADGMPDEWEMLHGFMPTNPADGQAYADSDPFNNLEEYIADTDPNDGTSMHQLVDIEDIANEVGITFTSSTSRMYRVESCSSDPFTPWTQTGLTITGQLPTTTLLVEPTGTTTLYRTVVWLP